MEGMIKASYTVLCKNDLNQEVSLKDILENEKVSKSIKSEFAKGLRNLFLTQKEDTSIFIKTQKEIYEFTARKNDFQDLLELAEEDARKHKRIKKDCDAVELMDIMTID